MKTYQAIARAFRPQKFSQVIGQEPVVKTLLSAIALNRVSHAYLFSGGRGSGKTTLARLFAKALNCSSSSSDFEPCNNCPSCKEIATGISLDLIEIDGASSRGIDDIRQINETIGYSPTHGSYKIYLIDEVHMLTKEAFNALLKTLEEPPPKAKFFFATTEPHKIPDTIKSRCQHFPLKRISEENIIKKLQRVVKELGGSIENAVLDLIAQRAEGSLRDAEGLLDQLLSSSQEMLTAEKAALFLGIAPGSIFDALDKAFTEDRLVFAFDAVQQITESGCDLTAIFEQLLQHFRKTLHKILCKDPSPYTDCQALLILEYLLKTQSELKNAISLPLKLEAAFLFIIHLHKKMTLEQLVARLETLEQNLLKTAAPSKTATQNISQQQTFTQLKSDSKAQTITSIKPEASLSAAVAPLTAPIAPSKDSLAPAKTVTTAASKDSLAPPKTATAVNTKDQPSLSKTSDKQRIETLLQFAAVELEGTIKRH